MPHRHLFAALGLFAVAACDPASAPADEDDDAVSGGKADGTFGVDEGTAEARAILRVANTASLVDLDDTAGLDRRAAQAIVAARSKQPLATLSDLDAVSFVGKSVFEKLLTFAERRGMVGRALTIATFNVRWFGLDGDLSGSIGDETRVATVRRFIDEHLADHDVLVFQEIVDTALFETEVMFDRTCVTYDGFSGKHQHVMVCHSPELLFVREPDDTNFAMEALNLGGLRPGVHGALVDAAGEPLAHVVAVHLKANETSTTKRLAQTEILSDRLDALADRDDGVPAILIGDFNTHRTDVTMLADSDEVLLGELLEAGGRVRRVEQNVVHTYRERDGVGFRLDQAWLSPNIDVESVTVPGACNLDFAKHGAEIVAYYDTVSDHCPVSLQLVLP